MKRLFLSMLTCFSVFLAGNAEQAQISSIDLSPVLTLVEIHPDVYVVDHRFPWSGRSLLVLVDPTTVVFVDTPYTPEATRLVVEWVEARYPDAGIIEINTGFHIDNLGGNAYLKTRGIPIYGSEKTAELVRTRAKASHDAMLPMLEGRPEYEYYRNLELEPPDHLFKLEAKMLLPVGVKTVEIIYPGESHSPDNLCVYFPDQRILFGGCMVKAAGARTLGNTFDANMSSWKTAIESLIAAYPDVTVIPGHGAWGGSELLTHTLTLFGND